MEKETTLFPEQYELFEKPLKSPITRRQVLPSDGWRHCCSPYSLGCVADIANLSEKNTGSFADDSIAAWIHINEKGVVTVYTGKVEVGQNIRTSLTQIVAEELRVPVSAIELIMGDTSLTPYDRGTYGSLTTPNMSPQLRKGSRFTTRSTDRNGRLLLENLSLIA